MTERLRKAAFQCRGARIEPGFLVLFDDVFGNAAVRDHASHIGTVRRRKGNEGKGVEFSGVRQHIATRAMLHHQLHDPRILRGGGHKPLTGVDGITADKGFLEMEMVEKGLCGVANEVVERRAKAAAHQSQLADTAE